MKKFIFVLIVLVVVLFAAKQVLAKGKPEQDPFTPVTLCHATGSLSNPFETITVDNQGQLNGHTHHDGDIIPAPENGCPGPVDVCTNLDGLQTEVPEGYVLEEGQCVQPPVDVCPNLEGLQTEIPQGYHLEERFGCIIDVPEPGPAPEPVRVETPLTEAGAPVCGDVAPAKIPNIFVVNAGSGKLEVRWIPTGGEFAHIFYGAKAGESQYSLINTPNDGVEVIGALNPGQHYWFAVTNGGGCAWSSLSDWFDPIVE
jgi:hypothetical protein